MEGRSNSRTAQACQLENLVLPIPGAGNLECKLDSFLLPCPSLVKPNITTSLMSVPSFPFPLLLPYFKPSSSFTWMAASSAVFLTPVFFLQSSHATPVSFHRKRKVTLCHFLSLKPSVIPLCYRAESRLLSMVLYKAARLCMTWLSTTVPAMHAGVQDIVCT